MQIILAHSNEQYTTKLKIDLNKKGFKDVYVFNSGFDALAHIITYHSALVIIEENLPDLNANDIKKALTFKGVKSKLIIETDRYHVLQDIDKILSFNKLTNENTSL